MIIYSKMQVFYTMFKMYIVEPSGVILPLLSKPLKGMPNFDQ